MHSVEVDPEVSETVRAFYGFSIEGDCWHYLSYCFVVEGAPQGLRLAWVAQTLSLGTNVTSFPAAPGQQ